jgi:hypothetical protein
VERELPQTPRTPCESKSVILQTATVDGTTIDDLTGKLVLLIEENQPWQHVDVMNRELAAKVRAYVRYLRSSEFEDEHDLRPSDCIVRLVSAERPGEATLELLERICYELGKHDIEFEYTVAGHLAPPLLASAYPKSATSPKSRNGGSKESPSDATKPTSDSAIWAQTQPAPRSHDAVSSNIKPRRNGNGSDVHGNHLEPAGAVAIPLKAPPAPREQARPSVTEPVKETAVSRPVEITAPERTRRAVTVRIALLVTWLAVAGSATLWGLEYYLMPMQERAYSELHEMFKPNGTVGLWYGIIGSLMIINGTALYSLRKRLAFLRRAGRLTHWLQFHIFLCTLGPYLVVVHTSFKFGGIASIAFWSMVAVVASGVLGRYLFLHIPRNITSRRALLQAVHDRQRAIADGLTARASIKASALDQVLALGRQRKPQGLAHALALSIHNQVSMRSLKRKIDARLALAGMAAADREQATKLVLKQIELEQHIGLLEPFQKMFAYWHVAHLPTSTLMVVVMFLHIIVAALFGYARFV